MPESQQSEKGTNIIVNKLLSRPRQAVLDIGAGEGKWGKLLKGKVDRIEGIEVWEPYINKYKLHSLYDVLHVTDMTDFYFSDEGEYNTIILGDVLEHLPRDKAVRFLNKLKYNADTIFLTIPVTVCVQDGNAIGNPFETHYYQWSDKEIRFELGFELLNVSVNDNGLVAVGCYEWNK